jgi:hypothetical protein
MLDMPHLIHVAVDVANGQFQFSVGVAYTLALFRFFSAGLGPL